MNNKEYKDLIERMVVSEYFIAKALSMTLSGNSRKEIIINQLKKDLAIKLSSSKFVDSPASKTAFGILTRVERFLEKKSQEKEHIFISKDRYLGR